MRHLRSAYPDAALFGSELEAAKMSFCAEQFGAESLPSSTQFSSLDFGRSFDLIWCGSLLTHLDEHQFRDALAFLLRSLAPEGTCLFTVHGRFTPTFQRKVLGYLPHDLFDRIEASYLGHGFGYADYVGQQGYGVSLSRPSFVLGCIEPDRSVSVRGYVERGWDDHQDVVIVQKRSIDVEWKGFP